MRALYSEAGSDAALDVALSHALLRAAAGGAPESARIWSPPPTLSFGRLDLLSDGLERAAGIASAAGLAPARRLAGGRAAAVGPGTACLGWTTTSAPMDGMQERYETLAAIVVEALSRLGIRARIGELEGEWCPGAWSVLVGEAKVGGLAQRVIRGAAWSEAVVVVSGAEALRSALDGVERALGIAWRPETLSGLEGVAVDAMREALADALRARWDIKPARVPAELWDRAHALRAEHAL